MSTKKKSANKPEAGSQKSEVKGLKELDVKIEEIREMAETIISYTENLQAAWYEFNVQAIALRNELKQLKIKN